jgi:hypothetical protein
VTKIFFTEEERRALDREAARAARAARALRAEGEALVNDPEDRTESAQVLRDMEALRMTRQR